MPSMLRLSPLRKGILMTFISFVSLALHAQTYVHTKTRSPQLHIKEYKQIAMGDIVGPMGRETERSLDLRDAVTSKLFNSDGYEVVDRNELTNILSKQKGGNVVIIDEKTISALSKGLKKALLITGRLQSEKVDQKLHSSPNGSCTGGKGYYWLATDEVIVQLKITDVATGKMIFSGPVTRPIRVQTVESCEQTTKIDLAPVVTKAFDGLSEEVVKLLIPYAEQIDITFENALLSVLKNPFKTLDQVVRFFKIGDFEKGVEILKAYASDNKMKDNLKAKAHFNYAMGLFCTEQYEQAKGELKTAMSLNPNNFSYQYWYEKIDKEKATDRLAAVR